MKPIIPQLLPHRPLIWYGIFATRFPVRPNPIGFSIVKLLGMHENMLEVEGLDVLDGTPLLDIKPYVPEFD